MRLLLILVFAGVMCSAQAPAPSSMTPVPSAESKLENPAPAPPEVPVPTTTVFPQPKANKHVDPAIEPPPLPKAKLALLGGSVTKVDPIRNRMSMAIHGGKKIDIIFDQRTKITKDGVDALQTALKKGQRVYLDTQQVEGEIYAKQIQIYSKAPPADISGQLLAYDARRNIVTVRDRLSSAPVMFNLEPDTAVVGNNGAALSRSRLLPGSIVAANFEPREGRPRVLRELKVLAAPGAEFMFYGFITHLDVRGVLAVENKADGQTYEVQFSPAELDQDLGIGSEVAITARFDGAGYMARNIKVHSGPARRPAADPEAEDQPKF